jgi:hypothetical protein
MFTGGDRVRVPNPEGDGTVAAIFVAPGDSRRKSDVAWVRYEDGPDEGLNAKVRFSDIERE